MVSRVGAMCGAIALAIVASSAARAGKDVFPGANRMDEFELTIARSVHRVIPFKTSGKDGFQLLPSRLIPGSTGSQIGIPTSQAFFSEDLKPFAFNCERGAAFVVMREMAGGTGFAVAQCDSQRAQAERAVQAAAVATKRLGEEFFKGVKPDALARMGWTFRKSSPAPGLNIVGIPLLAGGHGIAVLRTVIAMSPHHVVVIRADLRMCEVDPNTGEMDVRSRNFQLCAQPEETLDAIAREILAALGSA